MQRQNRHHTIHDNKRSCAKNGTPILAIFVKPAIWDRSAVQLSKLPSNEKLREYYRTKFLEIGFNDEEMAVLMSKIDEHIATRDSVLKRK